MKLPAPRAPHIVRATLALLVSQICGGPILLASPPSTDDTIVGTHLVLAAAESEDAGILNGDPPVHEEEGDELSLSFSPGSEAFLWNPATDVFGAGPGGNSSSLVVRWSPWPDATQSQVKEDLAVMSRVLEKTVSGQGGANYKARAMGIDILTLKGGAGTRAIYVENTGALFFLRVPYPLLPPAGKPESRSAPSPREDSAWDEARQELYGRRHLTPAGDALKRAMRLEFAGPAALPYDEARVQRLRAALIAVLKNAARIRHLEASDDLIVCLSGPAPATAIANVTKSRNVDPQSHTGVKEARELYVVGGNPVGAGASMMTLRVSKADIDAAAEGKLSPEQFEQRVKVLTYTSSGQTPSEAGAAIGF